MQFELLHGLHSDQNATMIKPSEDKGIARVEGDHTFYKGDVFETDVDLRKLNEGGTTKFRLVTDSGPGDELESMTVAALYDLAQAEEFDIPPKLRKAQLVRAVRASLELKSVTAEATL